MIRIFLIIAIIFTSSVFAQKDIDQINRLFEKEVKSGRSVIIAIKNKKDLFVEGDFSVLPTARFDAFLKKMAEKIVKFKTEFDRLEVLYFNQKVPEAKFRSSVIARIFVEYGLDIKKVSAAYPFLKVKKSLKNDSLLLIFRNVKDKKIVKGKMSEAIKNFGPISAKAGTASSKPKMKNNPDVEIMEDDIPLL